MSISNTTDATKLAAKVYEKLGRISEGETITSADQTLCMDAYDSIYEELAGLHLVDWGPNDAVPTWAMFHIREIVANRIANDFGLSRNVAEEKEAVKKMAKHLAVPYSYQPIQAVYY